VRLPTVGERIERLAQASRLSATALNTGWTSVGELAITRKISLVAVCCSSASASRLSASARRFSRSRSLESSVFSDLRAGVWLHP
jgi:hypothetical protein